VDITSAAQQAAMSGNMSSTAAREVSVLLSANTGPYQQEMKKAASATEQLSEALHKVDLAFKGALKFAGKGMIGLGASMQAASTGAMWVAAQFEESFARVAKTTGLTNQFMGRQGKMADAAALLGFGENDLQRFENEIRALSTVIPVSVQELSYLADVAGTLGVESKNLGLFADTAAKLGAAINNLPSDQAIAGLANLIGAFGMAEEQVVNLGSSLADLANHTRGEANEMLMFSDRMAGTAVQVGMAAEEVLGLGAAISAIGAQPQLGASAIVMTMNELSRAIQGGGEELRKFAQALNMTESELSNMWNAEGGATAVLMNLLRTLNLQGEEAILTLDKLGLSSRGMTQVLGGLAAQYHTVAEAMGISTEAFEEGVAVNELAEVRFDTVIKKAQQFRQAMTEVGRSLGQHMLGGMKLMFEQLTNLVNLFNLLPQPVKTLLGMFTSLAGVLLIAGGAFTIFFATFHAFFMLLHMAPMLFGYLKKLLLVLSGGEATAAVRHLDKLIKLFRLLGVTLTNLPGAIGHAFTLLLGQLKRLGVVLQGLLAQAMALGSTAWAGMVAALGRALPTAAAIASASIGFLTTQLKALLLWFGRFFLVDHMVFALKGMGTALAFLTARMGPVVALFAKFLLPLVALAGAISLGSKAIGRWKETGEEATGMLGRLANAAGMAFKEVEALNSALNAPSVREVNLAVEGKELLDAFRELDQEDAQKLATRYGLQLLQGGQSPDEVRKHIEELSKLSGKKLVFEYAMEGELDIRSGAGLNAYLDSVAESIATTISAYQTKDDSWLRRAWHVGVKGEATPLGQSEFDDTLNFIQGAMSEANLATRLATVMSAKNQLQDAIREGVMDPRVAADWSAQIDAANILPEVDPNAGKSWFERTIKEPLTDSARQFWSNWTPFDYHDATTTALFGMSGTEAQFRDQMAAMFETDAVRDIAGYWEVRRAIGDITEEFYDLGDAIRGMNSRDLAEFQERVRQIGIEITEAELERLSTGVDFDTDLAHQLAVGQRQLDDADFGRFAANLFEIYPQQVGFVRAIEDANHELEKLMESGKGWGEEADRYRQAIKSWGDEWARIRVADLEREMNAMAAAEQVRHLNNELATLDRNKPYNVQVEVQIYELRQRALDQAVVDFRQVMAEYDRLIDQREETIRSHGERLEQMEENHNENIARMHEGYNKNVAKMHEQHTKQLGKMEEQRTKTIQRAEEQRSKAIENARKQHAKRLEQIDKQEKQALEDRVEAMASAFNIMQRIQATPTAEIGALQHNMIAQNRAMAEMTENINQLRAMGLSDDVMREMGLTDPKNFAQARRLLESALSDPSMIANINSLWQQRLNLSEAFVDESARSEIRERFDEARVDAQEALNEQIADINERHAEQIKEINQRHAEQVADAQQNLRERLADAQESFDEQLASANESYDRSIADANKQHQKQLESIAEALAKLGESSIETVDELIERASASGLEKLAARGDELKALIAEVAELDRKLDRERRKVYDPTDPASIDREFGIRYDETKDVERGRSIVNRIISGIKDRSGTLATDLVTLLENAAQDSTNKANTAFERGVDGSFTILGRYKYQDGIWRPAEQAAETGAGRVVGGVLRELRNGTTEVEKEMSAWARAVENNLNPVLAAVGADEIRVTTTGLGGRSGGSPSPSVAMAQGGMLPRDATIQPPGTLVQWAEPETGGEAFIPLAPAKRQRSLAIWEKTGELLGASFADGGFLDVPDLSHLGDIGDASEKAMAHTLEAIEDWFGSFGFSSDGALAPRSGQYGGVLPWVAWSANVVSALFGPLPGGIGGVGPRNNPSDHPIGLALDFMTGDNARGHALGDRIVSFLMSNWVDHAIKYIIWKQRITHGGAWSGMAGRGSRTADHWDHPHVSYSATPGPNWDGPMASVPQQASNGQSAKTASYTPAISSEGPRPSSTATTSGLSQPGTMIAMANGGIDTIPAWLTDGEFVMSPQSVDHYGTELFEALNARRFATGGLVGERRTRGREPMGGGQTDLVNALTRALANASFGASETNHWDVKVEARDVNDMIAQLDRRKRLSRLTQGGGRDV
jgi:TP901 family phage tail tape measure protein